MKKIIAIVAGGDSSEMDVSLNSAAGLLTFIDSEKYQLYVVLINKNSWNVKVNQDELIPVDKNDFSFNYQHQRIKFDFAYITIHGTPGENGLLQGYFEMIGMPYSTCSVMTSALTFNKFFCNQYLKGFGVNVANAVLLRKGQIFNPEVIEQKTGYPCFVKPNAGGSSFGVTKVKKPAEMQSAIEKAFTEGDEVIIETFVPGTEITCGIYKTAEKSVVLPVSEVVSKNEFFDFDAKYKGQVEEITPARISPELTSKVQNLTSEIYDILHCKGIVRIDYIITADGKLNLLEVNTTPGMTTTSFIPQQVQAAGLNIKDVMTDIIENEFNKL